MLRERSQALQQLLFGADLLLLGAAWVLAWVLRFEVLSPPRYVPLAE